MTTWEKAGVYLQQAVQRAATDGDIIVIQYDDVPAFNKEQGTTHTTYTWTTGTDLSLIAASNGGGTTYTPTAMGTGSWIGTSVSNSRVTFNGTSVRVRYYGITFRSYSNDAQSYTGHKSTFEFDDCIFWLTATGATCGYGGRAQATFMRFINCQWHVNNTNHDVVLQCRVEIIGGGLHSGSTAAPTNWFQFSTSLDHNVPDMWIIGMDLSGLASGATLFGDLYSNAATIHLVQCKLPTSYVVHSTLTTDSKAGLEIILHDCAVGDTHGEWGHYTSQGSTILEGTIKFTSGAAGKSWKITTNGNASYEHPYQTPWIDYYNTATSTVTPYFEIFRDANTTAYQNDEVWAEFTVKNAGTSVLPAYLRDRCTLANKLTGTTADQTAGAGYASWDTGTTSDWSGKIDSGSTVTPADPGEIRGRIVVGEPNITVYVDPQIRT